MRRQTRYALLSGWRYNDITGLYMHQVDNGVATIWREPQEGTWACSVNVGNRQIVTRSFGDLLEAQQWCETQIERLHSGEE